MTHTDRQADAELVRELRTFSEMETHQAAQYQYDHAAERRVQSMATRAADTIERLTAPPAGDMVMVPREPTDEMIEAAHTRLAGDGNVADIYKAMLSAAPPAKAVEWNSMDAVPRKEGEPILLLSRIHGVVEARWAPGEWSQGNPTSGGPEYSGAVWTCGDDAWQIEVEEGPDNHYDGEAVGWLPRSALPPAPQEDGK